VPRAAFVLEAGDGAAATNPGGGRFLPDEFTFTTTDDTPGLSAANSNRLIDPATRGESDGQLSGKPDGHLRRTCDHYTQPGSRGAVSALTWTVEAGKTGIKMRTIN
jgi:hypothetical protein